MINGSKQFIGGAGQPDYLYTLVNTDPSAPRHENISAFLIDASAAGVTIVPMELMNEYAGGLHFVFFDNVRVPSDNLIGQEGKGWSLANTTLELEHGGGSLVNAPGITGIGGSSRYAIVPRLVEYFRAGSKDANRQ